jgi:immune inhibitor A
VESFARGAEAEAGQRPGLWKSIDAPSEGLARAVRHGKRVLVLPVLFADGGDAPMSREELRDRIFGTGENSLRGYWSFVSGGALELEGVVLPWTRLPESIGLYRNVRDTNFASAAGPRNMARDALRNAALVHSDLRQFDDDGPDGIAGSGDDDGAIDLLLILHPQVAFEVDPTQMGPAFLSVQDRIDADPDLGADGIRGDVFMASSALGPLGVWAHEFGHLLGLEDLYDVDVNEAFSQVSSRGGLGLWSLMASGTWGDGGRRPSNLDPVSRRLLGWETRSSIELPGQIDLPTVSRDRRESVEVLPEGDWRRERFVLERRARRDGSIVDGDLPGEGVLVYRVDEALRENRSATGFWIDLLEADGRADLHALSNNGDATDPFDGVVSTELSATSNPSSQSRLPDASRIAPRIAVSPVAADASQTIAVAVADVATLRLDAAFFDSGVQGTRAHLGLGETAPWRLRFDDIGSSSPLSAQLQVQSLDSRVTVESGNTVTLVRVGSQWRPDLPVQLREAGVSNDAALITMRLSWELDNDPATTTTFDLQLPLRIFGGLDAAALDAFVPTVVAAGSDTTRFVPLTIVDLPLPAQSGWGLRTASADTYANSVEVQVEGPYFSPPSDGLISFWSTQQTEESLPGQAFDAGVVEVFLPQRGWRTLELHGGPTVHVVQRSMASLRGNVGLGGVETPWTAYTAVLPKVDIPLRLRFRFASDESFAGGWWSIAGLESGLEAASAELTIEFDENGNPVGRAELRGDLSRLVSLRFRYRAPGESKWSVASQLFTVPVSDDVVVRELTLSRSVEVATIALFAEVSAAPGGGTPELLLGSAAYRAPATLVFPRLLSNPTAGPVVFQLSAQTTDLRLDVVDARGRRVSGVRIPAGTTWYEWDATDLRGTRLASGVYFFVVEGQESLRRRFLLLR